MDLSGRLIIVSNRLPATVVAGETGAEIRMSSGGLATALRGPHQSSGGVWVGWPGDLSGLAERERTATLEQLRAKGLAPLELSPEEIRSYYDGFSNGIIWPLFHYLPGEAPADSRDWECYVAVNRKFASTVADAYRPGDRIWVQDYQLALAPGMIRELLPEAPIGFFLHIPFPSSEIFRTLPWREQILRGMLGADLIGFHTFSYLRHFTSSLVRILNLDPTAEYVAADAHETRFGVFPIGIDAARFDAVAQAPATLARVAEIRASGPEEFLLLGVDRLDYTKGIPRRLLAIERLLELYPEYRGRVRLIQVAVPSREATGAYAEFRRGVNELVGRINGAMGSIESQPVHLLHRSVDFEELAALYRSADVMLVTALRDGMNLVAKEFCASRPDERGALLLSEFTGAAAELGEAILVHPYDVDRMAAQIRMALEMAPAEQARRMRRLRERVMTHDVHAWASRFLDELAAQTARVQPFARPWSPPAELAAELRGKLPLDLYIDYDGTLAELQSHPDEAAPDSDLLGLLEALTRAPHLRLTIISGRKRQDLEAWLGHLSCGLIAEHGLHMRIDGAWSLLRDVDLEWMPRIRAVLDSFVERTQGSFIEEKSASLAWHYRQADREFGRLQAQELRLHLLEAYSNEPVELLRGDRVIEIRLQGVHKGAALARRRQHDAFGLPVAIGDDRTDEDMFAVLDGTGLSVRCGAGPTRAARRLRNPGEVRALLRALI